MDGFYAFNSHSHSASQFSQPTSVEGADCSGAATSEVHVLGAKRADVPGHPQCLRICKTVEVLVQDSYCINSVI